MFRALRNNLALFILFVGIATGSQSPASQPIDKSQGTGLSPAQIREALTADSELVSRIRATLVRQAYEHGRLLDAAALTNEVY
jgi:hypothetical protein